MFFIIIPSVISIVRASPVNMSPVLCEDVLTAFAVVDTQYLLCCEWEMC